MMKLVFLFFSMATPALACDVILSRFAVIETAIGESMLILKSEYNDPQLVTWLDSLDDDAPLEPFEKAKRLTHLIYSRFDRPEKFRGQSIDLIGRALHRFRARSFIKTYDRPLGYYLAGDIIRKKMAFPRHRSALLLAALENRAFTPKFHYGLINVNRDNKALVKNVTHAWLTLNIGKQELILDPTFDVVANVREVTMIGDQNPELKIKGVRYYSSRFVRNGAIIYIRYEETGERKPQRLSQNEVDRLR